MSENPLILFLLLLLVPASAYSMQDYFGHFPQNNEKVFQECQSSLQAYDDFIPGSPAIGLISQHPGFLELMQQIANQDALWRNRPDRALMLLIDMIENRTHNFSNKPLIAHVLDIFLTSAKQKGHSQFVNSLTPTGHRSILGMAIQKSNLACAQKALESGASLAIQCYSENDRQFYYPLKFALKKFGPHSPLVELLLAYNAPILPEDQHLLGPVEKLT